MSKQDYIIVLGTAHRMREPGKESPDKRLKECKYSREICSEVAAKLRAYGCKVETDYEPLDLPKTMQSSIVKQERNSELAMRVNYVNEICRQKGAKNVLYVSIHVNAVGTDDKWHDANGWQVCVSDRASEGSKKLANCLFDAAKKNNLKMRQPTAAQKYWPQSLYVLCSPFFNCRKASWNCRKASWNCRKAPWNCRKAPWNCRKPPWNCRKPPWNCRKAPYMN